MEEKAFKLKELKELIEQLIQEGYRVIAPTKVGELVLFKEVKSFSEITRDYLNPVRPIKEFFFPRTEKVLAYDLDKGGIKVECPEKNFPRTVIVGTRPYDAASLPILDEVFSSDYRDDLYQARREATTIISISCPSFDDSCFCTSVGYSPASREGSDILLTEVSEDAYQAAVLTDKGEKLRSEAGNLFEEGAMTKTDEGKIPPVKFDPEKIKPWLDDNFEHEFWKEISLKCLGCGSCSYLCPTCHCFDILDEAAFNKGERVRTWDACSFSLFTLHTSGHNPRPCQSNRFRQRIMHKYKYYPERFNRKACVGCGRCLRSCPVNMNMVEILSRIAEGKVQS